MKKLLSFLLFSVAFLQGFSQSLLIPTNPDSIKVAVNVGGTVRTVYAVDLSKMRLAKSDTINRTSGFTSLGKYINDSTKNAATKADAFVTTIAGLRANTTPSTTIRYYTKDYGQEGFWTYDNADNTSTDNTGTVLVSTNGKRFKRDISGLTFKASWFGIVGDNTTNNRAALQAALDWIYNSATYGGRATFDLGEGSFIIDSTIIIRNNMRIVGRGHKYSTATQIKMSAGRNYPMFVNDVSNGASMGTGIDGNLQRANNVEFEGITFINKTGTNLNADVIRLQNSWSVTFKECSFYSSTGFALRLLDCNTIHIIDCFISGSVYAESLADSEIRGNQMGPNDLPSVDGEQITPVLWLSETNCWKNIITENFIYNAPPGELKTYTATANSSLLTCTGHTYAEGTPVITETTNTAPNGIDGFGLLTYYVHVVDANTIQLARTRALLAAGTYITPTTAGTGTHSIRIGGKGNVFMNDGAQRNVITSNRFDQSYWNGLMLSNASSNTINGNTIYENGRANATGQSGVELFSANYNGLNGNLLDGAATVTATGTSNQIRGIRIYSSSTGNVIGSNVSINHTTANYSDAGTGTSLSNTLGNIVPPNTSSVIGSTANYYSNVYTNTISSPSGQALNYNSLGSNSQIWNINGVEAGRFFGSRNYSLTGSDNGTKFQTTSASFGRVAKTTAYTVAATDFAIYCDATSGAFTVTLPSAVSNPNWVLMIKKTDASANAITIATTSSQNMNYTTSATTYSLSSKGKYVWLQSNGTDWDVIAAN